MMGKVKAVVTGLGLGVFAMYVADPERGRTRRKEIADKIVAIGNIKANAKDAMLKDARNRLIGFLYNTRSRFSRRTPDDQTLIEHVRAQLGHVVSHPGAIEVDAQGGDVYMLGEILAPELDRLLAAIRDIPGVKNVAHELMVHESPDHIPSLQGEHKVPGHNLITDEWKPGVALAFGLAGAALAIVGITRRGVVGSSLGVLGSAILAKSWRDAEGKRIAEKYQWV
jgi:hypothetical protein